MTIYSYPGVEFTKDNAGQLPWIETDLAKVFAKLTSSDAKSALDGFIRGTVDPTTTVNWRENWYNASAQQKLPQFGSATGIDNPFLLGMGRQDFIAFCRGVGKEGPASTVAGWNYMFSGLELAHAMAPEKLYRLDDITLGMLNTCPALCGLYNTNFYNSLSWLDNLLATKLTDGSFIESKLAQAFRSYTGLGPSGGPA